MFFVLVPFLKRAPRVIIHLVRNAEKWGGGGSIDVNHTSQLEAFIYLSSSSSNSDSGSGFWISKFSLCL